MKNKKKILFRLIAMLLCAVMLLSVAACTTAPDDSEATGETESETAPVETMRVAVFSAKATKALHP